MPIIINTKISTYLLAIADEIMNGGKIEIVLDFVLGALENILIIF